MKKIIYLILFTTALLPAKAQEALIEGNKFTVGGQEIWFNGINTPWHLFVDFGRQDFDPAWWEQEFQRYADNHINLARVWIHCSGEVSPDIDADGFVTGASDLFWDHMDHLIEVSRQHQVYVLPALFSFDITKNSYPTHQQWRAFLNDPDKIQSYIDNVLIPLVQRYDDEPYLLGWEICNEPEWMFENQEHGPQPFEAVQRMHAMMAAAIHRNSGKPVTTGSAAPKWNSPVYDDWGEYEGNMFSDEALSSLIGDPEAYLDFYQYHWYPWQTQYMSSPFQQTTVEYGVDDRPVIVGEAEGNDVCDQYICQTVVEMYENSYQNGFDGMCAWKTPQNDGHGTFENIAVATNAFYNNHPDLVYPGGGTTVDVTGVSVSPTTLSLSTGQSHQLTATVEPANATDKRVSWSSSNTGVATVNSNGMITAVSEGTAEISVVTNEGGFTAICAVTVEGSAAQYTLAVTINGQGIVSLDPDGAVYDAGSEVTLTATPSHGYEFTGWRGALTGSVNPASLIMDADKTVAANFEEAPGEGCDGETPLSLPFIQNGAGEYCWVTTGSLESVNSWNLDLLEINGVDYANQWANSFPPRVDGAYHIRYVASVGWAHLEIAGQDDPQPELFTLTINAEGMGSVSQDPEETAYEPGSQVLITATADPGWRFDGWSGDLSGSDNPAGLIMNSNKSVTAIFTEETSAPDEYTLTTSVIGEGTIAPDPAGGTYEEGEAVTVTAVAGAGYAFTGWSGDLSGASNPAVVIMDSHKSIQAIFEETDSPGEICDSPEPVSLPFTFDGAGEFCWAISGDISYINSWAVNTVEVNGVAYANQWAGVLPADMDGVYYVSYSADAPWAHFEAVGGANARLTDRHSGWEKIPEAVVYPNPSKNGFTIRLEKEKAGRFYLEILNLQGKRVYSRPGVVGNELFISARLEPGSYFVRLSNAKEQHVFKIEKY